MNAQYAYKMTTDQKKAIANLKTVQQRKCIIQLIYKNQIK
jgi:hypothetical protein